MKTFDLTVALTVHSESLEAGLAIRSAEMAIELLIAEGYSVQRIVGLDCATPWSREFIHGNGFELWEKFDFAFGDQGLTRNALVEHARGRVLAFLDADDLFSENWLLEAMQFLKKNERAIAHPEIVWQFEGADTIYTQPSQSSEFFIPQHFALHNYYDAICMAPIDAWREVKYPPRDIEKGFAYEDWQWGWETMRMGWEHVAIRDTIIFKRRRANSQSQEAKQRKVVIRNIDALKIENFSR